MYPLNPPLAGPAYIWQEDIAKIPTVPGTPRNVNPARAIIGWYVGLTMYYIIFQ